uniref:Uncharacterized protein n=1 Tax=Rhipicephalus microplus TaxID=6941 RepID=A0A6G5A493_RHIMP
MLCDWTFAKEAKAAVFFNLCFPPESMAWGSLYVLSLLSFSLYLINTLRASSEPQMHCLCPQACPPLIFFQCDDLELSLQAACPCCILFRVCYSANILEQSILLFSDNGYFCFLSTTTVDILLFSFTVSTSVL